MVETMSKQKITIVLGETDLRDSDFDNLERTELWVKRFFDYEKEETNDQKLKRELENLPPPELPWSFELTYLEFGKRYRWIGTNKVWKRYKELTDCGTMMKMS